jgi:CubicO group peptidase (beta-lactamase class C family)
VIVVAACGSQESPTIGACRTTLASPAYRTAIEADRALLPTLKRGLRAPGLSIAVAVRGRVVWSATCGFADTRRRIRVHGTTQFRIGSVSKTLTAAALVHYADTGVVDLDAPITRYLPRFPHGRAITLRRLAGHLAGIRHYETLDEVVNRRRFANVRATLAIFANDPLVTRPGTRFAYSTYGYDVIGAALESATHMSLPALAKGALVRPSSARLMFTSMRTTSGVATGYGIGFEVHPGPSGCSSVTPGQSTAARRRSSCIPRQLRRWRSPRTSDTPPPRRRRRRVVGRPIRRGSCPRSCGAGCHGFSRKGAGRGVGCPQLTLLRTRPRPATHQRADSARGDGA